MADSGWWEQLEARGLPEETVPLPVEGGTVDLVLRALPADEWDALCEAFPAQGEDVEPGTVDLKAMRPALLAASVVAPDGSPPRDPAWWDRLGKKAGTSGELDHLSDVAWRLNRPYVLGGQLGKG